MTQAQAVPVKGDTLIWARLTQGLNRQQAAALLGIEEPVLANWETNGHNFTVGALRGVAGKYNRPVSVFLRSTTPTLPAGPEDFRTVGGRPATLTVDTLVAIRDAQRVQVIASELLEDDPDLFPATQLPTVDIAMDSPEEVALVVRRDLLRVSDEPKTRWKVVNAAYNGWKARIQMLGIIVLSKRMPRGECRGFSLYVDGVIPVIAVNQREVDQAKIFTLFHELAHLLIRRHAICLEREDVDQRTVERWCNEFAASLLVPSDALARTTPKRTLTMDDVVRLADDFKVSRPVIALSLERIGRASDDLYLELKAQAEDSDWSDAIPVTQEEIRRSQDQIKSAELGVTFPKIVLEAWRRELITTLDAADYLDMRAEKLEALFKRTNEVLERYRPEG